MTDDLGINAVFVTVLVVVIVILWHAIWSPL